MNLNPANQASLRVAVLMGGNSAEAEISRTSAAQIEQALTSKGHQARTIELNPQCAATLMRWSPDVVFPALHGPPGEDGTVQGFLEIMGLPYVGSGVLGSAIAMDKAIAKQIFRQHHLPVTQDFVISGSAPDLAVIVKKISERFGTKVVIKPLNQGSAIGVTPMPEGGDMTSALRQALTYGGCLVEPFIRGKEITVGVLAVGERLLAHPVIEIQTPDQQWYNFNNRYTPGSSLHIMPAGLPAELLERLQDIAVSAHQQLGLSDLSRADFIVSPAGEIALLEVNSLPGMTPTSLYPEGAAAIGYPFERLIDHLVRQAVLRGPRR